MARSASLKPYRSTTASAARPWCVDVPPHLSDTGKRKRLFFETKGGAQTECEKLKVRKDNFGISLNAMTPSRIAEASEAYKLLDPLNVGLLDAVRGYLAAHKARTASVPYLELFNQFLKAKKDRNLEYQRELRITRDRFPSLHERLVSDITHLEVESVLSPLSPGARNPVMRYLRAVFFFGIKNGYLAENPISRLDFAEVRRKEVETIPSDKVEAMLIHALENDLDLLPFLVLGFFCGIRPDGELQKVEWADVKLSENVIVIRPEVSKTNRRRFVDLSDNAKAWMNAYGQRGGTFSGRVANYDDSELRGHRIANWQAAGIKKWVQQGMRHTYCSNWLSVHKDINRLVLMSGHDSVDTMWRAYHAGIPEAEAKKFWQITPPQRDVRTVIEFPKTA